MPGGGIGAQAAAPPRAKAQLKEATAIRAKEAKDFGAQEKEPPGPRRTLRRVAVMALCASTRCMNIVYREEMGDGTHAAS